MRRKRQRGQQRPAGRRCYVRQSGVTLLELLVVMALASVLLAVVVPSVGAGLRTLELRSAAQRLAASARYARNQAVHRQRFYELEIDAEAGTVTVTDFAGESQRSFELPGSVRVESILPEETAFPHVQARMGHPSPNKCRSLGRKTALGITTPNSLLKNSPSTVILRS